MRWLADPLARLHGHLFGWLPVCLGLGIGLYFARYQEPSPPLLVAVAVALVVLAAAWRLGPPVLRPMALAVGLVALGLLLATARAHLVQAPVLGFRYYGPV